MPVEEDCQGDEWWCLHVRPSALARLPLHLQLRVRESERVIESEREEQKPVRSHELQCRCVWCTTQEPNCVIRLVLDEASAEFSEGDHQAWFVPCVWVLEYYTLILFLVLGSCYSYLYLKSIYMFVQGPLQSRGSGQTHDEHFRPSVLPPCGRATGGGQCRLDTPRFRRKVPRCLLGVEGFTIVVIVIMHPQCPIPAD